MLVVPEKRAHVEPRLIVDQVKCVAREYVELPVLWTKIVQLTKDVYRELAMLIVIGIEIVNQVKFAKRTRAWLAVEQIMIVHLMNHASTINVLIHVPAKHRVVQMRSVVLKIMKEYAHVKMELPEIQALNVFENHVSVLVIVLVQRIHFVMMDFVDINVDRIWTVLMMKNVPKVFAL